MVSQNVVDVPGRQIYCLTHTPRLRGFIIVIGSDSEWRKEGGSQSVETVAATTENEKGHSLAKL